MVDERIDQARKGRGAVTNRSSRYEAASRISVDDGWWLDPEDAGSAIPTVLGVDKSRTIITTNQSPDVPFTRSINPYKGCEHGCIYCFARPTHAYLGLSPGLDFETRLFHKPDAPQLLVKELSVPGYVPDTIAIGANTDPYQPVERSLGLTRSVLQVLSDFSHPFGVITKSALILRDLDLLDRAAAQRLVQVCVSVTTLDRALARRLEPRAASPDRRLETIRHLSQAGVPVAVLASPMIPGLNDHELDAILQAAAEAGACSANTILLRLPLEISDLFREWLEAHYPDRARRVLSLIRQCRDGGTYQSAFGLRMSGSGPYAALLRQRFDAACRRYGLLHRQWQLDASRFAPPPRPGEQLSLFP